MSELLRDFFFEVHKLISTYAGTFYLEDSFSERLF